MSSSIAQVIPSPLKSMCSAISGRWMCTSARISLRRRVKGCKSALENLDEKTTTVLLIDDNSDDALLIRRLLEGYKAYRVYHAKDGWEGLSLARQKLPDLIVSDLTMPGMDGFGVVEELKLDPRTRDIPVMVVSAKDITPQERRRLNGHIEAVYQKGSLPARKFVDQVIHVIEETSAPQGEVA